MQMRTILIGAFALVFGISAALGVFVVMNKAPGDAKAEMVSLVVAAVDINRGQSLTPEMLEKKDWPKDAVPEGTTSDPASIVERTVTISMLKGDLLQEAKLAPKGTGRGLAAVIPPGMRAVTIQTPNVSTGVAGFILPGNKVDVFLTMSGQGSDDKTGGGSTITLLQNVEILAVDQRIEAPSDNKMSDKELRSVTLMVTPADAAKIDLGQNKGTLRLGLRNPKDTSTDFVEPVTLAGLLLNPNQPAEAPKPKPVNRGLAEVIPRGMRAVTIKTPNVATRVGGFIMPGSKVDVLLSMSGQGQDDKTGGGSTITLLQNIEVMAVDQQAVVGEQQRGAVDSQAPAAEKQAEAGQEDKGGKLSGDKELWSVTLLVNPSDAARLDLGNSRGILHLHLRNPDDTSTEAVAPVTLAGLLQKQKQKEPKKQAVVQIRTLRGTQSGSITFNYGDDEDYAEVEEPRPAPPPEPPMPLIDPAPAGQPLPATSPATGPETPKPGTKET